MSEYSYDDRPRRHRSTREREPEYVAETTYIERGAKAPPVRDLVYRPRDHHHDDSIEDITREFPPPGAEYRQTRYRESYEPRRARSVNHRGYDDRSDFYGSHNGRRRRHGYDDGYSSDEYDRERPKPSRRKSVVDALKDLGESAGLGGVIGAVAGKARSRSRSRHRKSDRHDPYDRGYDSDRYGDRHGDRYGRRDRRHSSSSRSRSGGRHKSEKKWEQAATDRKSVV